MQTIELNMYQAIAVAVLMLLLGRMMVSKIEFLRRYCIPAPVVGGLVFAIIHMILRSAGVLEFQLDTTLQSVFMTAFFCSVGYMAAFKELKKGGVGVIKFLIVSIVMCCIQDLVGGFGAKIFGLDPRLGLTMGSIPLVGGHGTAGSFGPFLEDLGVANATTVAVAAATYGLIAGCMIGGPIAVSKIRKYNLKSSGEVVPEAAGKGTAEVSVDENTGAMDESALMDAALYIVVAVGAGTIVSALIGKVKNASPGKIIGAYGIMRAVFAAFNASFGGVAGFVRPVIMPMMEGSIESRGLKINEDYMDNLKGMASGMENIAWFFCQVLFVGGAGGLLVQSTLEPLGYHVELIDLAKAEIPVAIFAVIVGIVYYYIRDKKLAKKYYGEDIAKIAVEEEK